jgi:hypothetical protein
MSGGPQTLWAVANSIHILWLFCLPVSKSAYIRCLTASLLGAGLLTLSLNTEINHLLRPCDVFQVHRYAICIFTLYPRFDDGCLLFDHGEHLSNTCRKKLHSKFNMQACFDDYRRVLNRQLQKGCSSTFPCRAVVLAPHRTPLRARWTVNRALSRT